MKTTGAGRRTRMLVRCLALLLFSLGLTSPDLARATYYVNQPYVTFAWSGATEGVHHFNLYLSLDGGEFVFQRAVFLPRSRVRLTAGRSHRVRVDAENAQGLTGPPSDPSDEVVYLDSEPEADTDRDGIPDWWEILYGLDPFRNDAQEDPDGDGVSNLAEYLAGTDPRQPEASLPPLRPVLVSPAQGAAGVLLRPELRTGFFIDPNGDAHAATRWQIRRITADSVSGVIELDVTSGDCLTSLRVPESILDPGEVYGWRVRFRDSRGERSPWSPEFFFTTVFVYGETAGDGEGDGNGAPGDDEDLQSFPQVVSADPGSGTSDSGGMYVWTATDFGFLGLLGSAGVASVDRFRAVHPDEVPDEEGRPASLPHGLIGFRASVGSPGEKAEILLCFSEALAGEASWYGVDSIRGWRQQSALAAVSTDGHSARLTLQDGGAGDVDGVANGRIVTMGGFSAAPED